MSLMIGIDQGGTKTDTIIADQLGTILTVTNDSGFTDWTGGRRELRDKRLAYTAHLAMENAGVKKEDIDMVVGSCNGIDWEFERELRCASIHRDLGIQNVMAVNDAIGAMWTGRSPHGRNAAVLCIGTGSNVAVQSASGESIVFSYYMRDALQGGAAIGKRVFELVFASDIGLYPETKLAELLLNATGFSSVRELMMAVTTGRNRFEEPHPINYKQYAWIMLEAYHRNDPLAKEYLESICRELIQFVVLGTKKLNAAEELQVVFTGGIIELCLALAGFCKKVLLEEIPDVTCVLPHRRPVLGTVLMWLDQIYDHQIPRGVLNRLEQQSLEKNLLYRAEETIL